MTQEEKDQKQIHLVATLAAILLQPHISYVDGFAMEVGPRRGRLQTKLDTVVAIAEDLVATVYYRSEREPITEHIIRLDERDAEREIRQRERNQAEAAKRQIPEPPQGGRVQ